MFRLLVALVIITTVLAGTALALVLSRVEPTAGLPGEEPWRGGPSHAGSPEDD